MDLYGHRFDGSDQESADRMQKLFGNLSRDDDAASDEKVVVISDRAEAETGLIRLSPHRRGAG
jgi:hypothetical protein